MSYTLAQEQRCGSREINQDYAAHAETGQSLLLAVADGMGGYFGGELAAEIAIGSLCHSFSHAAQPVIGDPETFLERAIAKAHVAIQTYADEQQLPEVPRTVVVACVVQDGRVWWNHVGDARLYLVRQGRIEIQTRDHTPVQELVDAGEITSDEAYRHPDSIRVGQSLGAPEAPEPGPGASARLQDGDVLLLCSDGFWGPLRPNLLVKGLDRPSLRQSILELSDTAERRAGAHSDNLTVLALQWQEETTASAGEATQSGIVKSQNRSGNRS